MHKGETEQVLTVTVVGSNTASTPDGVVAIVLETLEQGKIGFSVTLDSIAAIRRELAAAELAIRSFQNSKH